MKKQNINKFDLFIQNINRYINYDYLEIVYTHDEWKKFFEDIIISDFSKFNNFKSLQKNEFIKFINKDIAISKLEFNNSNWKKLNPDFKLDFYEFKYNYIRSQYPILFHYIENYDNSIISFIDKIREKNSPKIEKILEKEYKYFIKKNNSNFIVSKIRWICNCEKHNNGYPNYKSKDFPDILKGKVEELYCIGEKIKIEEKEFFDDMDYIWSKYLVSRLYFIFHISFLIDLNYENPDPEISNKIKDLLKKPI